MTPALEGGAFERAAEAVLAEVAIGRDAAEHVVRAVLGAVRSLNDSTLASGMRVQEHPDFISRIITATAIWQAMIDSLLSSEPTGGEK